MTKPILWGYTDSDIIDELSRIEYDYGITEIDEKERLYLGAEPHDRNTAVIASALIRIMRHLGMGR